MKYLKIFEHFKSVHFSDGYYINACNICNQIMAVTPFDMRDGATYEELMDKKFDYLIDWIAKSPEKAITFGNKTNATSRKISKRFFDILVSEFPEKSNIEE